MPRITITVPEKTAQPYRFQLDRQVVSLGRGSENDIAIESGSVSVHHAEMRRISGGYELHDVGSTNGIKLDDMRYEVIPLESGASVKIGDVSFDFTLTEEENEIRAREKSPGLPELKKSEQVEMAPPPKRKPASYGTPSRSGSPFAATLMFLILAAVAFFTGMSVRFQKETGKSLIDAIKMKSALSAAGLAPGTNAVPATPVEAPAAQ